MKTMYGYWDKVASVSLYWVYTYELSVVVALLWNKVPLEYIQRWIGKESYIWNEKSEHCAICVDIWSIINGGYYNRLTSATLNSENDTSLRCSLRPSISILQSVAMILWTKDLLSASFGKHHDDGICILVDMNNRWSMYLTSEASYFGKPTIWVAYQKWLAFFWPYHWRSKMAKSGLILVIGPPIGDAL